MSRRSRPSGVSHPVARVVGLLVALVALAATGLAAAGSGTPDVGTRVVAAAKSHLGDPYVYGATGPDRWDCSGLTSVLWRTVGGVSAIPRTAHDQQAWAVPIPVEQARAGDLVFFGDPVTHVGFVESTKLVHGTTTVTMLDASDSRTGVVERQVWTSGVIRYGRVPRPGMPPVTPWAAPKPTAAPTPAASPTAKAPVVGLHDGQPITITATHTPLLGLPSHQSHPSSTTALKASRLVLATVGKKGFGDTALISNVWRRAGGGHLPSSRSRMIGQTRRVPLSQLRVGDLLYYGAPGPHVGMYVGQGMIVDASAVVGKVVQRRVWKASSFQVRRLPG